MHSLLSKAGLPAVGIFSELGADERAALLAELETLRLKRGDVLVRQGETADALYIVVSGRFAVTLDGRRDALAELGPDQPIGEIAFLAGGTRTATVTALRDSLVLRLGRAEFERISAKCPSIWRTLTVALAQRVAATTASEPPPPDPRPRTIAIIRAGGAQMPAAFVDQLTSRVLAPTRNTLVLDAARWREACCRPACSSTARRRRSALNALESSYDYVLFIADAELTPWSEKAIRQADLVLAVGDARAPTRRPIALEQLAAALVATRGAAPRAAARHAREPISGTARWLAPPQPRHAPPRRARRPRRRSRASTASSTAPRSASSPAAAAPTARPTSASTRR